MIQAMDASSGLMLLILCTQTAMLSFGKRSVFNKWRKQKINTTNSTKAELVGTHELMSEMVWINYFLEEQGYHCEQPN